MSNIQFTITNEGRQALVTTCDKVRSKLLEV